MHPLLIAGIALFVLGLLVLVISLCVIASKSDAEKEEMGLRLNKYVK